jgi:hypothetical protein
VPRESGPGVIVPALPPKFAFARTTNKPSGVWLGNGANDNNIKALHVATAKAGVQGKRLSEWPLDSRRRGNDQ